MATDLRERVPLYLRLPEIYRTRDAEQMPPFPLREYLAAVEEAFGVIHENIESLYHDLFIETCDDWVIPYLADLLGTSHLKGEPRTLRADVADTIALRRRKGTLAALERLTANLTGWAAHCVELRELLGWTQHLNHQRPDAGGAPPYNRTTLTRFSVPRGGTAPVRDPAMLRLLDTPFDPFAHTADVKRANDGAVHHNLPNLAIFLWRLAAYRIALSLPVRKGAVNIVGAVGKEAAFGVRFDVHPLDRSVVLFNTYRANPRSDPPALTGADQVPGAILDSRLTSGSEAGNPAAYVGIDTYDPSAVAATLQVGDAGLQLFLPKPKFAGETWKVRGDNLCAWQDGLRRPLQNREIVIDPDIGRLLFGVAEQAEADALDTNLLISFTYGAPGEVGAHPISRGPAPAMIAGEGVDLRPVDSFANPAGLQDSLANIHASPAPIVVEIRDSLIHDLDLSTLPGATAADGFVAMQLNRSLVIRAASGHRPIIRLAVPLRFRPTNPGAPEVTQLIVRLEGVHVAADPAANLLDFPVDAPLIARAAVARLELLDCTLDPGGFPLRDGTRAPLRLALGLPQHYGFASAADEDAFAPTPDILVQRSITGALLADTGYRMTVQESIVDAGAGVDDNASALFAISSPDLPATNWGAPLVVRNATFLGRVRVESLRGSGGIWVHRLEVLDNQRGCVKLSWFSGNADRLPPNHGCLRAAEARLAFTSEWFGDPGHAQLSRGADAPHILTRGPGDDEMGAWNFLEEAHRWQNLQIRFREFMPVGVRPLLIAVT